MLLVSQKKSMLKLVKSIWMYMEHQQIFQKCKIWWVCTKNSKTTLIQNYDGLNLTDNQAGYVYVVRELLLMSSGELKDLVFVQATTHFRSLDSELAHSLKNAALDNLQYKNEGSYDVIYERKKLTISAYSSLATSWDLPSSFFQASHLALPACFRFQK